MIASPIALASPATKRSSRLQAWARTVEGAVWVWVAWTRTRSGGMPVAPRTRSSAGSTKSAWTTITSQEQMASFSAPRATTTAVARSGASAPLAFQGWIPPAMSIVSSAGISIAALPTRRGSAAGPTRWLIAKGTDMSKANSHPLIPAPYRRSRLMVPQPPPCQIRWARCHASKSYRSSEPTPHSPRAMTAHRRFRCRRKASRLRSGGTRRRRRSSSATSGPVHPRCFNSFQQIRNRSRAALRSGSGRAAI